MLKKGTVNWDKLFDLVNIILFVLTFVFLGIDTLKGPGASTKHFFIDGKLLASIFLVLALFVKKTNSKVLNIIYKFNQIVLSPIVLLYLFCVWIEASHYPNYFLSVYKIHLKAFVYLPLFSASVLIVGKCKKEFANFVLSKSNKYVYIVLMALITFFSLSNVGESLNAALNNNFYIFSHMGSSYNQKMTFQWGSFYNLISFVKANTPENAKIVIPPETEPWLGKTGDIKLMRGFLYPRTIIQYVSREIPNADDFEAGTYILISWGDRDCLPEDCHGWPNQKIVTRKVLYKDPDSDKVIETKNNFVYEKDNYKFVYGLIEI